MNREQTQRQYPQYPQSNINQHNRNREDTPRQYPQFNINQHNMNREVTQRQYHQVRTVRGYKDPLSNFYPSNITHEGIQFKSSEHLYQYQKAIYHQDDRVAEQVLRAETALEAMRQGEAIQKSESWREWCIEVMRTTLCIKAQQVDAFRNALADSGSSLLAEATRDRFWGSGLTPLECRRTRCQHWPGNNNFGHLLMEIRQNVLDDGNCRISKAIVITDSHGQRIIPEILTGRQKTDKIMAYTFKEAKRIVQEKIANTDLVCLQVGTNDARRDPIDTCTENWMSLIKSIRDKEPHARLVVGTIPPMRDPVLSKKASIINVKIQAHYSQDNMITFADNNVVNYFKDPHAAYENDGIHLKEIGFKRLAQSLKRAIFTEHVSVA